MSQKIGNGRKQRKVNFFRSAAGSSIKRRGTGGEISEFLFVFGKRGICRKTPRFCPENPRNGHKTEGLYITC